MKKITKLVSALLLAVILTFSVSAVTEHRVVSGDTMWKLSKKYGVTLQSVIDANPHIKDPNWIYPGDVLYINTPDTTDRTNTTDNNSESGLSEYATEVVRLTNAERAKNGLKPLTADAALSRTAQLKSQDMYNKKYFSHTSPTYGSPFQMMKDFGISYRYAGENIAMGQRTPAEVVKAWMDSPGHRANILNSNFTKIGVGYVSSGSYWTQMFTG